MNTIPDDYNETKANKNIKAEEPVFHLFSFGDTKLKIGEPYAVQSLQQFINDEITPKDSETFEMVYDAYTHIVFPIYLIDLGPGELRFKRLNEYFEKHPEVDPINSFTVPSYISEADTHIKGNPLLYKKSE